MWHAITSFKLSFRPGKKGPRIPKEFKLQVWRQLCRGCYWSYSYMFNMLYQWNESFAPSFLPVCERWYVFPAGMICCSKATNFPCHWLFLLKFQKSRFCLVISRKLLHVLFLKPKWKVMKHCHVTRDDTDSNKQDDAINGMMLANRLFNFTFSSAELVLHATNISIRRANKHIETERRKQQ